MASQAQTTKEEERQQRKIERQQRKEEKQRMWDEATEKLNSKEEKTFEDGIYRKHTPKETPKEIGRKGATALIVTTSFQTPKEVLDILVRAMVQHGDIPKEIDKEYYLIKTEQRQIGSALYDIRYAIYQYGNKVKVRANATAYGSFSVGMSVGMYRRTTEMVVPVEYGDNPAWKEMEKYLLSLPLIESTEYITEKK
jgi:hypothetical protein